MASELPTLDLLRTMAAGHVSGISISDTVWIEDGDVVGMFSYSDERRAVFFDSAWPPTQALFHDSTAEAQRRFVYDHFATSEVACDIVAVLILPSVREDADDVSCDAGVKAMPTTAEKRKYAAPPRVVLDYLTVDRLQQLMLADNALDGTFLLSKFVVPAVHHSLVYCVYAQNRVLGLEQRINVNSIRDRTLGAKERTCTSAAELASLSRQVELSTGTLGRLAKIVDRLVFNLRQLGCTVDRLSFYFCVTPPVAGGVVGRYVLLCASEAPAVPAALATTTAQPATPLSDKHQSTFIRSSNQSGIPGILLEESISWAVDEDDAAAAAATTTPVGGGRRRMTSPSRNNGTNLALRGGGRCTRPLTPAEIRGALHAERVASPNTKEGSRLQSAGARLLGPTELYRPGVERTSSPASRKNALVRQGASWNSSTVVSGSSTRPPSRAAALPPLRRATAITEVQRTAGSSAVSPVHQCQELYVQDLQDACLMGYLTRPQHLPSHLLGQRVTVPGVLASMGSNVGEGRGRSIEDVQSSSGGEADDPARLERLQNRRGEVARSSKVEPCTVQYEECESTRALRCAQRRRRPRRQQRSMNSGGDKKMSVVDKSLQRLLKPSWFDRVLDDVVAAGDAQQKLLESRGEMSLNEADFAGSLSCASLSAASPRNAAFASTLRSRSGSPTAAQRGRVVSAKFLDDVDRPASTLLAELSQSRRNDESASHTGGSPRAAHSSAAAAGAAAAAARRNNSGSDESLEGTKSLRQERRERQPGNHTTEVSASTNSDAGALLMQRRWWSRVLDPTRLSAPVLAALDDVYGAQLVDCARERKPTATVVLTVEPHYESDAWEIAAWLGLSEVGSPGQQPKKQLNAHIHRATVTRGGQGKAVVEIEVTKHYASLSLLRSRLAAEAEEVRDFLAHQTAAQLQALRETVEGECRQLLGSSVFCSGSRSQLPEGAEGLLVRTVLHVVQQEMANRQRLKEVLRDVIKFPMAAS